MKDFATSENPAVQTQLDRLAALSLPEGRLGLGVIRELLARLGDPHKRLPPTFHVAGTNGKGSTCAFLRAMLEADGYRVHVTTSPHLVRYNERIRLAGKLIGDEELAATLAEVLDAGEDLAPSFFEVTIATAFLAFSRARADACVVEVGLGGRFDATNVLGPEVLAACGIAALGIDHERFLLAPEDGVPAEPMARIAFEKAGIAKPGVPLVTLSSLYPGEAVNAIGAVADKLGAPLVDVRLPQNADGPVETRAINAALASAMIKAQNRISVSEEAIAQGMRDWTWPARLQTLGPGPLTALVGSKIILDGAHNPNAGKALAGSVTGDVHLILGMLANKDPRSIIEPFAGRIRSLIVVPVPGHESHPAQVFGPDARAAANVEQALLDLPVDDYPVLIAGSLYLAGAVLKANDEVPD